MPQATPSRQGQARTASHTPHAIPAPQVPPPPAAGAGPAAASNSALRQLRLRRFWTQADLAAAFEARSRQIGRPLSLSVRQVRQLNFHRQETTARHPRQGEESRGGNGDDSKTSVRISRQPGNRQLRRRKRP